METFTGTFQGFDTQEIFYRCWKNTKNSNDKIVVFLHRGHEHSQRLEPIVRNGAFADATVYAYDYRGHGNTQTEASYEFMDLVRDLDCFVRFVCVQENKPMQNIFVVANSVAGVVASTWVHDYAPNIKGMALVAPAFSIKLYVPLAKPALDLAVRFFPKLSVKSYVKAHYLTHDVAQQFLYNNDPLIKPDIPAKQLTTLLDTAQRVVQDAQAIVVPTLVLCATKDFVVDSAVEGDFFANLSSPLKRFVALEGFYHGVLYEENAHIAIDAIAEFIRQSFDYKQPSLLQESVRWTQNEHDRIMYGSLSGMRKINYILQTFFMKKFGFLSQGMQIGLQYGFDSGVTLDYVYENTPKGVTKIGELIDKAYLNSIGWKGIRKRKHNTITLLTKKIEALLQTQENVTILDIAGGPARYLIELAATYKNVTIYVRDYQEQNIKQGQKLAKERGLENIHYEQADAFAQTSYSSLSYRPDIVVISGVFELFNDNDLIQNAIEGVASSLREGGYLLYTGQPWHPQLEQIANVLGNHQQRRWVMRRRTQYELDTLFQNVGFTKLEQSIDDWGIFSASIAQLGAKPHVHN